MKLPRPTRTRYTPPPHPPCGAPAARFSPSLTLAGAHRGAARRPVSSVSHANQESAHRGDAAPFELPAHLTSPPPAAVLRRRPAAQLARSAAAIDPRGSVQPGPSVSTEFLWSKPQRPGAAAFTAVPARRQTAGGRSAWAPVTCSATPLGSTIPRLCAPSPAILLFMTFSGTR